jgi:hypothetical protein
MARLRSVVVRLVWTVVPLIAFSTEFGRRWIP